MIPSTLGEGTPKEMMSPITLTIMASIQHYIVEEIRSARRFLRWMDRECDIDSMTFEIIGKNRGELDLSKILAPISEGKDIGLLSEAGCPGIADPGSKVVAKAHELGMVVVPISGPSSFYMALMASGLNGQQFQFNGYVPKQPKDRAKKLLQMENDMIHHGTTQIFMDAPYRNQHVLDNILQVCRPSTLLCVAADIAQPSEYIKTRTISDWKNKAAPDLRKRPCVFLLGR